MIAVKKSQAVTFDINPYLLGYYNPQGDYIAEFCTNTLMVSVRLDGGVNKAGGCQRINCQIIYKSGLSYARTISSL